MLSNKLTFSLALVVMLVLITGPALAQTVTTHAITLSGTDDTEFLVITNTDGTAVNGITIATQTPDTAALVDLEEVLTLGGTIELVVEIAEVGSTRAILGDSTTGDAADDFLAAYEYPVNQNNADLERWVEDNLRGDFVITEIMWGLNRAGATPAEQDNAQWIEIYNNGAAIATGQTAFLVITENQRVERSIIDDRGATDDDAMLGAGGRIYAVVDRFSTINFRGVHWAPLGQSGRLTPDTNSGEAASPLISMYRKADLNASGNDYNNKWKFRTIAADAAGNRTGDGTDAASWAATPEDRRFNMTGRYYVGTPGHPHLRTEGDVTRFDRAAVGAADDGGKGVIINEFRNDTTAANEDWVELINNEPAGSTPISVSGWRLWLITAPDTLGAQPNGQVIAVLPNYRIAPGEYLLIVNQDPENSSLAAGRNINDELQGRVINSGAQHVYFISDFTLPNDGPDSGQYLLVLRRGGQTNFHENFEDFAGNGLFPWDGQGTQIYPLRGWQLPPADGNWAGMFRLGTTLAGDMSYGRRFDPPGDPAARNVARSRGQRLHNDDWLSYGPQGGIGYDPTETGPGTPGYANPPNHGGSDVPHHVIDDRRNNDADDDINFDGTITFSEIMYDAGPRDNLAQWIELYNSSMTDAISIDGWELDIRNRNTHDGDDQYINHVLKLRDVVIPPNRTLLLVSRPVNSRSRTLDQNDPRLYDLYTHHRVELGLNLLNSRLLSPHGFYLELRAPSEMSQGLELQNPAPDVVMDIVGNLMFDRNGNLEDPNPWELPALSGAGEPRTSLVRLYGGVYGSAGYTFDGGNAADIGTAEESWRSSTGHRHSPERIYYGAPDDISTPAFRLGGPLPVSLSSFRPVRDAATGAVVIRWITESELNNAGFNILRSETKNGEFTVVNLKGLIPGHGTTSEKHVYEWTDTTAKPNVVYYYQIEDVSFDGQRTTLRTTHLRGNVNAAGKVTTTWGDLKTQQ